MVPSILGNSNLWDALAARVQIIASLVAQSFIGFM